MTDQPGNLLAAVRDACIDLIRTNTPVTFAEVAARTGISRTTLYRRRELRELIEQHRDPTGDAITLTGLAIQIERLRQALEAVAANVRRHDEHLRALKRTERAN
jgi:hypothetical protein